MPRVTKLNVLSDTFLSELETDVTRMMEVTVTLNKSDEHREYKINSVIVLTNIQEEICHTEGVYFEGRDGASGQAVWAEPGP